MSRATLGWIVLGWIVFAVLPWHGFDRVIPTLVDYVVGGSALIRGLTGS